MDTSFTKTNNGLLLNLIDSEGSYRNCGSWELTSLQPFIDTKDLEDAFGSLCSSFGCSFTATIVIRIKNNVKYLNLLSIHLIIQTTTTHKTHLPLSYRSCPQG